MEVLVALAFFATPATAMIAAVLGFRALTQPVPDGKRFAFAAALVVAPWIFIVLLAQEHAGEFVEGVVKGPLAVSPLVAIGLAIGALLCWGGQAAISGRNTVVEVWTVGASLWRSLTFEPSRLTQLRWPDLRESAVALAVLLPIMFWFGIEGRSSGHHNPIGGLAGQILLAIGTLAGTMLSIGFALLSVARPAEAFAIAYSWLSLGSLAGLAVLWSVGYWEAAAKAPYLHYWFAPALKWMGAVACAPALIGQVVHLARRRVVLKDDFVDWIYRLTR